MIAFVIVTYNGIEWYDKCFGSILDSTLPTKIIVVDNASIESDIKYLQDKYPDITLIQCSENLGFAKANNLGIKYAMEQGAEYIFLLNQDAWIKKDTVEKLIAVFETNPDAGIVTSIHLNGSYSGLDVGFAEYLSPHNTPLFISDMFLGNLKPSYKTNFVNAAAWLISRKCIEKVGVFDTSLFTHYGEDDNYCQRAKFHRFEIYISTKTTICHDRADRIGRRPEKFEKQNEKLDQKLYYANPFLANEIIDKKTKSLEKNYFKNILKYSFLFDVKKLKYLKRKIREDSKLFTLIKKSREAYLTNGLMWLDDIQP